MKINLKKTCAVLLAGGIVLTPAPSAKTLNVNTEEVRNIKTNLSYVKFCELVYNVSLYLKRFGLEISNFELSNSLYIQNIAFIDDSTKEELIKNNMISDDKKILIDLAYTLYYRILTTTTTNRYVLPFNSNEIQKGNGDIGWE